MGSVLLAAIVRAMQIVPGPLENARIRFAAPIDMRPDLGNANDFVLSMAMARGASPPLELGLWESARWIGARLRSFRSLIEFEAAFQGVEQLLSMNLPSAATVDALAARGGHDVMLSNLGSIDLPQAAAEGISQQAVWGPSVLVGYEGEHTVGSATWNGALHLVYTSHSPLRRLLEGARRVLMEGCTAGAKA